MALFGSRQPDLPALKRNLERAAESGGDAATETAMRAWLAGAGKSTPDEVEQVLPGFKEELGKRGRR
jgi:hypothetical protein